MLATFALRWQPATIGAHARTRVDAVIVPAPAVKANERISVGVALLLPPLCNATGIDLKVANALLTRGAFSAHTVSHSLLGRNLNSRGPTGILRP